MDEAVTGDPWCPAHGKAHRCSYTQDDGPAAHATARVIARTLSGERPDLLGSAFTSLAAEALKAGRDPTAIFDSMALAVATFIAGAHGSPVDHRAIAESFHAAVMAELPKARHRIAKLARTENLER